MVFSILTPRSWLAIESYKVHTDMDVKKKKREKRTRYLCDILHLLVET